MQHTVTRYAPSIALVLVGLALLYPSSAAVAWSGRRQSSAEPLPSRQVETVTIGPAYSSSTNYTLVNYIFAPGNGGAVMTSSSYKMLTLGTSGSFSSGRRYP